MLICAPIIYASTLIKPSYCFAQIITE